MNDSIQDFLYYFQRWHEYTEVDYVESRGYKFGIPLKEGTLKALSDLMARLRRFYDGGNFGKMEFDLEILVLYARGKNDLSVELFFMPDAASKMYEPDVVTSRHLRDLMNRYVWEVMDPPAFKGWRENGVAWKR